MKERRAFMLQVAREVLTGRISVEEAMQRSQVKDKRTIVSWVRRAMREHNPDKGLDLKLKQNSYAGDFSNHSAEEKITKLVAELEVVKQQSLELLHFKHILTNKINELEALIHYAEKTYSIAIFKNGKCKEIK
ncbi:hypothetical protein [Sphingobacterium sp. R2]|uniref:hypothetical protein n=1 Tax=Sphingobacterium sp. R2 TaxID=3112958 RepID=UPI00345DFD43